MRHMGATKAWIIAMVQQFGVPDGDTRTVDQFVADVQAYPYEIITGCDCPKAPDGSCLGTKSITTTLSKDVK